EQFQPFPAQAVFEIHKAGNVAARPGQVIDEAGADRIGYAIEHNRNRPGLPPQRRHAQGASSQDDVRRECDQFCRVCAVAVAVVSPPAGGAPHVAAGAPAQLLQDLWERREAGPAVWIVRGRVHEHADTPNPLALLRPRRERPRRRTAEQSDERAPPHSITSSASASSLSGIWRPSAFAVLRLMASSNLFGNSTGRSAGFAPLRMRPAYIPAR